MRHSDVPKGWTLAQLDDVRADGDYTFVGGPFGSDLTQQDYVSEGVPVIRGTNLGGTEGRFVDDGFVFVSKHKAQSLRKNMAFPGDILFTQRGTLGQVAVIPKNARFGQYVISQSQMKLTPDASKVDSRFLFHHFRAPHTLNHLLAQTQATGVPHISLGILKRFPVTLPPLPEQRRIAAILDKADGLRAKRRASFEQLSSLRTSVFARLFGDPRSILDRWNVANLGDSLGFLTSGSRGWARYYKDDGALFLRIQNVRRDELSLEDVAYVHAPETAEAQRTRVQAGDVLLSITADLGRTAVVPQDIGVAFINQHLAILRTEAFESRFLSAFLASEAGRRQILARNRHGVKAGLNFDDIRSFKIPNPPHSLQREFGQQSTKIDRLEELHRQSARNLDAAFDSLQHQAFAGAL